MNTMSKWITMAALLFLAACNNQQKQAQADSADSAATMQHNAGNGTDTLHRFSLSLVDDPKDLVCGMPLKVALEDTVHYQGKVYGFCSQECKHSFQQNPTAYVKK